MKAKIKSGHDILFTLGVSNEWKDIGKEMNINFKWKYTYIGFKQYKNHLLIDTTDGQVDIVFTSIIPKLEFYSFCKDQLTLKVV